MNDRPLPLPDTGKYTFSDWCTIIGVTSETVKEHMKQTEIPTMRLGNLHFIDAAKWWHALENQPKKGGE